MAGEIVRADVQEVVIGAEIFGTETISAFLSKCRSDNTRKTYSNAITQLQKFFAQKGRVQPNEDSVNEFFADLAAKKKSPSTRRLYLTVTKNYFAFVAKRGIYPDVAAEVKEEFKKGTTHKKSALTVNQAQKLLRAVKGDDLLSLRDRAIIALALQTGVRTCEIERANIEDFNPNQDGEGYLLAVTGKGHSDADATVRVAPAVVELILAYLDLRGEPDLKAPLFASTSRNIKWKKNKYGVRLSAQSVQKIIKRAMIEVGIRSKDAAKDTNKKISPHSCRHFAATTAIKAGIDIREVAAMLRHTSVNITAIYLHDMQATTRRAEMAVADTLFGGAA